MTQSLRGESNEDKLSAVLAKFDDNAQIAFEIERSENGFVTLFLPGAPDPWSEAVIYMTEDRVTRLDTNFKLITKSLKRIGKGTTAVLDKAGVKAENLVPAAE
jgi:uncharacterized membrane protein